MGGSAKPGLREGMSFAEASGSNTLVIRNSVFLASQNRLAKPFFLLAVQKPIYIFSPDRRTHWPFFFSR
jgi:hypothetical protein